MAVPQRHGLAETLRALDEETPEFREEVRDYIDNLISHVVLEVMSRFATDPRWLIYLPPTMSPSRTSERDGYLEYPTEALAYYQHAGVTHAICEEKHMGSRAIAIVCRTPEAAAAKFGVATGEKGMIATRTGRRFIEDRELEQAFIFRMAEAAERAGIFTELNSEWMLIDLELMPWSAKAVGLLRDQYAPVGAAALASAAVWQQVASGLKARGLEGAAELQSKADRRSASADRFRNAYRRYCWTVAGIDDYKLAPFHLLASEGAVHVDKNHEWHMETLGRICDQDPAILRRTPYRIVDLGNPEEIAAACAWWETLVNAGGEGMVVKPLDFIAYQNGKALQPALKCRGPEYLRIIYGPEYLEPEHLVNLRRRGLTRKSGLAAREFALGLEAMERFVKGEPLRRVHECVFGVLALESEPVDPRL